MAKIARGRGQKILGVFFGRGGGSIVLNPDDQQSNILTVLVIWISIL